MINHLVHTVGGSSPWGNVLVRLHKFDAWLRWQSMSNVVTRDKTIISFHLFFGFVQQIWNCHVEYIMCYQMSPIIFCLSAASWAELNALNLFISKPGLKVDQASYILNSTLKRITQGRFMQARQDRIIQNEINRIYVWLLQLWILYLLDNLSSAFLDIFTQKFYILEVSRLMSTIISLA